MIVECSTIEGQVSDIESKMYNYEKRAMFLSRVLCVLFIFVVNSVMTLARNIVGVFLDFIYEILPIGLMGMLDTLVRGIFYVAFSILPLVIVFYLLFNAIKVSSKTKRKIYSQSQKKYGYLIDDLKAQEQTLMNNSGRNIERILPRQYWQTSIIDQLILYISSRRADTLKEALNLFAHEEHNRKIQQLMSNLQMQNTYVAAELASTKSQLASINRKFK